MKKNFLNLILAILMVFTISTGAIAGSVTIDNWNMLLPIGDSATRTLTSIDQFTFQASSLVNSTVPRGYDGDFKQYTTANVTAFKGDDSFLSSGVNDAYQMTFVLEDVTGNFVVNSSDVNEITYETANLKIYLDTNLNYGATSASENIIYGANDGTLIAAFKLLFGSGTMDFFDEDQRPDGRVDIAFVADQEAEGLLNGFLEGIWFDKNGKDLSSYDPEEALILALTDSNNHFNPTPTASMLSEFGKLENFVSENDAEEFQNFFAESDGSFRLGIQPIPEPASLVLMGFGLIGLGAGVRCKKRKTC